ncbi:MAG: SDR family NAD(P)-dependent oxidoreductase [Chitinophagaceae bacterium]|nr:MAG: SDR family NAD(P)-dependent oxidoreductase [Chitinophagaceae bacterium]
MKKIVVITGANKGLGKSFLDIILQDKKSIVLSLSRELHDDHSNFNNKNLFLVPTDLSKPFSEELLNVLDQFLAEESVIFLFNNAGTIVPIKPVGTFSFSEIKNSIAVNINYPVNLVNSLIKRYPKQRISIINITSGARNNPIQYWSLYGSAKAYMAMFFKILDEENNNLSIYDIDPGVLDTGMQKTIRENTFPKQNDFIAFKSNQQLVDPAEAAERILKEVKF